MLRADQCGKTPEMAGSALSRPDPEAADPAEAQRGCRVTATIHPSAILRQRDEESRHDEMAAFVRDLELVASVL